MPNCFVAMGFGQKTAFYLGKKKPRVLDLDKTYQNIIKPAVTAAGVDCIRADEIQHSTLIDLPMYQQLLGADVMVADVSTSNANAIYELGVRHALKPRTTIVMAENDFAFPFDIQHLSIIRYQHLGEDIGATEADRVKKLLTEKLKAVLAAPEVDSPVFIFLPGLTPQKPAASAAAASPEAVAKAQPGPSLADLRNDFHDAKSKAEFEEARSKAKAPQDWLPVVQRLQAWRELEPTDPFVIQQLALATYKAESPDRIAALEAAAETLEVLQPQLAVDAETVGLWGAIHKRLWDARRSRADLDEAIRSYERGFQLKNDHYNGINLAFLLNIRAKESGGDEAVADRVWAARTRSRVLEICDQELKAARTEPEKLNPSELYWLRASRAEALFGLSKRLESEGEFATAKAMKPPPQPWMIESTENQLKTLEGLLA
jgi:tetratricopeptide (TPR) repeat protein